MIGSAYEDVLSLFGEPSSGQHFEDDMLVFYSADYFTLQLIINIESNLVKVVLDDLFE